MISVGKKSKSIHLVERTKTRMLLHKFLLVEKSTGCFFFQRIL